MPDEIEELRKLMMSAQPSGRGNYIEEGRHLLEIQKVVYKRSAQSGTFKESYIAEFTVKESSDPSHEIGSTRAYVESGKQGWLERFKAFLIAAVGIGSDTKLTPEQENTIADIFAALKFDQFRAQKGWPENFLKGRHVRCEGVAGKSKGGGPVTNKKWEPYVAPPASTEIAA